MSESGTDRKMAPQQNEKRRGNGVSLSILLLGLAATIVAFVYAKRGGEADAKAEFDADCNEIQLRIAARMARSCFPEPIVQRSNGRRRPWPIGVRVCMKALAHARSAGVKPGLAL